MAKNFEVMKVGWASFIGGDWKPINSPQTGELVGFEAIGTNCKFLITDDPKQLGLLHSFDVPTKESVLLTGGLALIPENEEESRNDGHR